MDTVHHDATLAAQPTDHHVMRDRLLCRIASLGYVTTRPWDTKRHLVVLQSVGQFLVFAWPRRQGWRPQGPCCTTNCRPFPGVCRATQERLRDHSDKAVLPSWLANCCNSCSGMQTKQDRGTGGSRLSRDTCPLVNIAIVGDHDRVTTSHPGNHCLTIPLEVEGKRPGCQQPENDHPGTNDNRGVTTGVFAVAAVERSCAAL